MLHHLLALSVAALVTAGPGTPYVRVPAPATPAGAEIESLLHAPGRRVRASTPELRRAVEDGLRRSPAFAAAVRTLERTDVIVHLVEALDLPRGTHARLWFSAASGPARYLRVEVRSTRGDDLVALIAHELQHALEIAVEPDVRCEQTLEAHYRRIGFQIGQGRSFDTDMARRTERQVRRELRER